MREAASGGPQLPEHLLFMYPGRNVRGEFGKVLSTCEPLLPSRLHWK